MSRTLFFFYILVTYVLLQFSWWAYLLIDLNKELLCYHYQHLNDVDTNSIITNHEKILYTSELKKRFYMVFGEGAVFISLLVLGISKIRGAFFREVELARQQKNFLLYITHEFKSPLAAVKLNLQTLQKRMLEPIQREEIIRKALVETDRIHLLVENTLLAARLESHNYELYFEEINFSDFIHITVSDYIERQDHDHIITHEICPGIHLQGDKLALTSLIYNLLENAEKYSPLGSNIHINLFKKGNDAFLLIKDEGNGIPPNEYSRIFEKFYRIGNEETRRTKGTGLGLFIVQHIAGLHKSKINVSQNVPKGTIFEIRFPLN